MRRSRSSRAAGMAISVVLGLAVAGCGDSDGSSASDAQANPEDVAIEYLQVVGVDDARCADLVSVLSPELCDHAPYDAEGAKVDAEVPGNPTRIAIVGPGLGPGVAMLIRNEVDGGWKVLTVDEYDAELFKATSP